MHTRSIALPGIGSILIDDAARTLQPRTPVVAMRIGIGYRATTSAESAKHLSRQNHALNLAGVPVNTLDWQWLDHNGNFVKMA